MRVGDAPANRPSQGTQFRDWECSRGAHAEPRRGMSGGSPCVPSREWLMPLIRRMDGDGRARLDVPRHRRALDPGGVPPQDTLRRHHHPARQPQLLGCSPSRSQSSHRALASYLHRKPSVSTRLSQRSRLALANADASASFRHLRWSSLRDASSGSVSGGSVRPKSPIMATSSSQRRAAVLARSTRPPFVLSRVRSPRHSATNGAAGPKACSSSGCASNVTTPASGIP